MLEILKRKREERILLNNDEPTFYNKMATLLESKDVIPNELYIENKVKRGLRNSNGTGVVVGLTRIGEVCGYTTNENKDKRNHLFADVW